MESFEPFRVVGSICGGVPVSVTNLYGAPVLMVATGRTYQLFKGKALAMIRGGPTYRQPIRTVAQAGKYRFVGEGPRVHAMVHHKPLWTVHHEELTRPDVERLLAQDDLLLCLGADKRVVVREVKTGCVLQEFLIEKSESVTAMQLLPGYNNKLLVSTEEGTLHLYNFKTGRCVWYAEKAPGHHIVALTASEFKDIVAYGTSDGRVVVLNLASDVVIATFTHQRGAVTALVFRADHSHLLVAGTSLGEVVVWNLEERCMDAMLTRSKAVRTEAEVFETPHMNAVHSLITFTQPESAAWLVTGGADNALMQFRFDTVDGLGLVVRERRGHMGGCTVARFFNADLLVTAGVDRALRVTHIFSDRASWELSQGRLGKKGRERQMGREALKMPPAIALASCTTRNYQWASLTSLHTASAQVCGWRMDTRALEFKLSGIQSAAHTARAVAMSDCGNFAVVGYSSGNATVMNLQNKSLHQLFDRALDVVAGDRAHESAVECVEVACGNTTIITAGLDGYIKFWTLPGGELKRRVYTGQPMTKSCVHQSSSLLIVAENFCLRVYHCNPDVGLSETELRTPVRELEGHRSPITALALAPDSDRYVVSASGDGALLLWDLAAAACVGQYRFPSAALSISFHPDALFLATTHAGERGTFLWVNNLRYGFVPEVVPDPAARALETYPWMHYPTAHGEAEEVEAEAAASPAAEEAEDAAEEHHEAELFDSKADVALMQRERQREQWRMLDAIPTAGIRLAGVPRATWFNLTVLDQIKEKNMPLLPPKKKDVPFFLPTTQELRPTFIVAATGASGGSADDARGRVHRSDLNAPTPVQQMLLAEEHEPLMHHLLALHTAPAIDLELKRVVEYVDGGEYTAAELERMQQYLRGLLLFFTFWLRRGERVDLVQGLLADALRSHGALIARFGKALVPALRALGEEQNRLRYRVDHLLSFPDCLAGTFSGSLF